MEVRQFLRQLFHEFLEELEHFQAHLMILARKEGSQLLTISFQFRSVLGLLKHSFSQAVSQQMFESSYQTDLFEQGLLPGL